MGKNIEWKKTKIRWMMERLSPLNNKASIKTQPLVIKSRYPMKLFEEWSSTTYTNIINPRKSNPSKLEGEELSHDFKEKKKYF